jgi:hypothetical protein
MNQDKQYMEYNENYTENTLENERIWYSKHNDELISLRQSINLFLSSNSINSIYELCLCFEEPVIINTYQTVPDIAYCIIAITISMEEFNAKITHNSFLLNVRSIDELISKIKKYKFLLLNLEFKTDEENSLNIITYDLINNNLSTIALYYLIKTSSVNKDAILNKICKHLNNNNKKEELLDIYHMLNSSQRKD